MDKFTASIEKKYLSKIHPQFKSKLQYRDCNTGDTSPLLQRKNLTLVFHLKIEFQRFIAITFTDFT